MEQAIFRDHVPVSELPALWNQKMQDYLQITPSEMMQRASFRICTGLMAHSVTSLPTCLASIYDGMFLETLWKQDLGKHR